MSEGNASEEHRLSEEARVYGLEERTFEFARRVRAFIRVLPRTLGNVEDARQLIRSSGSVGANFIESSEALSPKDHAMRLWISRKEAKESRYWLRLLHLEGEQQGNDRQAFINEARELMLILNSLVRRAEGK